MKNSFIYLYIDRIIKLTNYWGKLEFSTLLVFGCQEKWRNKQKKKKKEKPKQNKTKKHKIVNSNYSLQTRIFNICSNLVSEKMKGKKSKQQGIIKINENCSKIIYPEIIIMTYHWFQTRILNICSCLVAKKTKGKKMQLHEMINEHKSLNSTLEFSTYSLVWFLIKWRGGNATWDNKN